MRFDLFNVLRRAVGLFVAVLLLLVLTADVSAGPLGLFGPEARDRRASRRGCPAPNGGGCGIAVPPGVTYALAGGNCANGSCPIPAQAPAQFPATLPGSVPGK